MGETNLLPQPDSPEAIKKRLRLLVPAFRDAIQRGLLSEDEIRSAFVSDPATPLAPGQLNLVRTEAQMRSIVTTAAQRLEAAKAGDDVGPLLATGKSFIDELIRTVMGAGIALGDNPVAAGLSKVLSPVLGNIVPVPPRVSAQIPAEMRTEFIQTETAEAVARATGMPTDPVQQQVHMEQFPATSRIAGMLGAFGVMAIAAPVGGTTGVVGRVLPATGRGIATRLGAGVVGAGGGLLIAPEDASGLDKALFAIGGAAGAQLLPTVLMGRPFGAAARELIMLERSAVAPLGLGPGIRARSAAIGRALIHNPRGTFGQLASSGALGAAFGTTRAASQGAEPLDALREGVKEGGLFIAGDMLLARLGTVARSMDFMTRFNLLTSQRLQDIGFFLKRPNLATTGGAVAQAGGDILLGGAAGAGIAELAGGDAGQGFQIGAFGGAGFTGTRFLRDTFSRYRSLLPASTIKKAFEGKALTGEELGILSSIITKDAAETIARDFPEAVAELIHRAVGPLESYSDDIIRAEQEIGRTQARIYGISPLEETLPELVSDGFRILRLREGVAVKRVTAEPLRARLSTQQQESIRKIINRATPKSDAPVGATKIIGTSPRASIGESVKDLRALLRAPVLSSAARRGTRQIQDLVKGMRRTITAAKAGDITEVELRTRARSASEAVGALERKVSDRVLRSTAKELDLQDAVREAARSLESSRGIIRAIERLAGGKTPLARVGERGEATAESVGGIAGAGTGLLGGPIVGSYIQELLQDTDDPTYAGPILGAIVGTVLGAALGAKAGGYALSRFGNASLKEAVKFFKAPDNLLSDPAKQAARVGNKAVKENEFFKFSIENQAAHLSQRVASIAGAGATPATRKSFESAVAKFTPTAITPAQFDDYAKTILDGARRVGMDETDAFMLLRGSIGRMRLKPIQRNARNADLRSIARDARFLAKAENLEELRKIVETAKIISGPEAAAPSTLARHKRKINQMIVNPDLKHFKKIIARADSRDTDLRGTAGYTITGGHLLPFLSRLSPPQHFFRIAQKIAKDDPVTGREIREFTTSMFQTVGRINEGIESSNAELRRIFHHVKRERRVLVPRILQEPDFREATRVADPALYDAAMNFRKLIDNWADRAGLPAGMKVEEYYPWIYNLETIERLARKNAAPTAEDMFFHVGATLPEHKIAKNLLERTRESPAGPIVEDPFEAGQIYLQGVIRKTFLDPIAVRYDDAFFEGVSKSGQAFTSRDMARWFIDVWGIPSQNYKRVAAMFHNLGVSLEPFHMFNQASFTGRLINQYAHPLESFLKNPNTTQRMISMLRGIPVYTKLGLNFISGAVNLSQFVINGGTEFGMDSIFLGGPKFIAQAALGKFGEMTARVAARIQASGASKQMLEASSGFLNHTLGGEAKLRLGRELGIFGAQSKRVLNEITRSETRGKFSRARGGAAGAATGFVGANIIADEDSEGVAALASIAGGALGLAAPSVIKRALRIGRDSVMFPFNSMEIINRTMTTGAAIREIAKSEAVRTGAISRARSRATELAEFTGLGAATGAAAGAVGAPEGERGREALAGAGPGAILGLGIGAFSKSRSARIGEEIRFLRERGELIPSVRDALVAEGPLTLREIERAYVRQAIDTTQFLLARTGRPEILREPVGEVLGALQSFTLNQFEFVGSRFGSMIDSIVAGGKIDTRFLRFAMLTSATAAVYQNLTLSADEDTSSDYWLSRFGLGILPMLRYNRISKTWELENVLEQLAGPVISDIHRTAQTIFDLTTDPKARDQFNVQMDSLVRDIFIAMNQFESHEERLGSTFEALGFEGLSELMDQRRAANFAQNPFTTATRGDASPERTQEFIKNRGGR